MRHLGRTFLVVWAGQVVSNVGSRLTSFGLALWVFTETGSVTRLATIVLAARLPMLLISPFAGALVDRWSRRTAMIVSDSGAALGTLATATLLATGTLEIWHLYVTLSVAAGFAAFQFPAYSAAVTLMVPREHHTRAAGMVQLAGSVALLAGPVLAAAMLTTVGLTAIFVADLATFAVAVGTLVIVRFPEPKPAEPAGRGPAALLSQAMQGWRFLTERGGLLALLISFAAVNFAFSFQSVLLLPLLLGFASETTAGAAISISSIGIMAGSLLVSGWGGPADRIRGLLVALGLIPVGFVIAGLRPSVVLTTVGITALHFMVPIASSISQAIWQSKVPPVLQGRVFAMRSMTAIAATPVAILLAGPLADGVFEPLMARGGALAGTAGAVLGSGPGRGIALFYVVLGFFVAAAVLAAWSTPRVRNLDREIPDAIPDAAAVSAA